VFIKLEMDSESDVAKNTHVSIFVYYDAVLVDSFFNGFWVHQIWLFFMIIRHAIMVATHSFLRFGFQRGVCYYCDIHGETQSVRRFFIKMVKKACRIIPYSIFLSTVISALLIVYNSFFRSEAREYFSRDWFFQRSKE